MENNKSSHSLIKEPYSFFSIKQELKRRLLGPERPMKIRFGIAKGIRLILDPMHKTQFILGLAEAEISGEFKKFARTSDTFFDIGAASGYFSLIYRKWNKKGQIHLFEPDPAFSDIQKGYFIMNNFSHDFQQHANFVGESEISSTVTVDGMIDQLKLQNRSFFFKIDVDGGEVDVLKGATRTLAHQDCKLIMETHSLQLEEECASILRSAGYSVQIIKNAWWRFIIKEIRPIEHNRWLSAYKKS